MKIVCGNISLSLTDSKDCELQNLFCDFEELVSMSEVRLYPENMPGEMSFRVEHDEELIGELRLKSIRWFNRKGELSIIIKKEYQGKGYGSDALNAILNYAFKKMNFHRIEAEVIENNNTSIKLLELVGFKQEGRLREAKYSNGNYYDILKYGILKEEYEAE